MAVSALEATLRVCYCPTRTFAHELLVIWPVACLAWLPCTEHQSYEHLSHEGISVGSLGLLNGSQCTEHQSCEHLSHEQISEGPLGLSNGNQSPGSNFTRLLLPYKDLRARTFGNLTSCVPSFGYYAHNIRLVNI